MKTKLLSMLMVLLLAFGSVSPAMAAENQGLSNFKIVREYDAAFSDVSSGDWFYRYVSTAYKLNLMSGVSSEYFNVNGDVTVAETITVAAKLHSIYFTGSSEFTPVEGEPWYQVFVDYARTENICTTVFLDYNRPATRAEYATIIAHSMPEEAFAVISDIDDGAVPDVPMTRSYASDVYKLYRAGILAGSDEKGNFKPDSNIRRSEVATILTKLADSTQRREITLKNETVGGVTAVHIAARCAPAVFYIEMYDAEGYWVGTGSGFFIESSGIAVTNYHVISEIASAKAMLYDGTVCEISGVYDYDIDKDIALIQVEGENFQTLTIGNSDAIVAGQTVFAIGSPDGLDNSISQGIISNISRYVDGMNYIQFTAPISSGSSGGALIDEKGTVIGITSASMYSYGESVIQNLNLAIPIKLIEQLSREEYTAFGDIIPVSSVFADAYIRPSETYIILAPGETKEIDIYESTGDKKVSIHCEAEDYGVVSWKWTNVWKDDNTTSINITGKKAGETTLRFDLLDATGGIICRNYVSVIVTSEYSDFELSANPSQLVLREGKEAEVNIYVSLDVGGLYLSYAIEGGKVDCLWAEEWTDYNNISLTVTGLQKGTDVINIYLFDENDVFLKSIQIQVKII